MWGAGEPSSKAAVRALELEVGQRLQSVAQALGGVGLAQERRALRLRVQDLRAELTGAGMIVEFRLGPGAFATAVLRELVMTGES
jgi:tRNA pseudouridine13 synthase